MADSPRQQTASPNTARQHTKAILKSIHYHGRMKKQLGLALACLWLTATPVLAQTNPSEFATPSGLTQAQITQKTAVTSPLDSSLFYELLLGELTHQANEPATSFALMLDAARKTGDAQLYQRATEIALQARSGDLALQATRAWKQALPTSREANRYQLQILIALNRIAETIEPLKTEIETASNNAERLTLINTIPQLYVRTNDKKLAATVVENALADSLKLPLTVGTAWASIGRMRVAADDLTGALEAAQHGHNADARAESPVVLALGLINPKLPDAEKLVQHYLQTSANTARYEIRLAYVRALLDAQRQAEAHAQLKILTHDQPTLAEGWLLLGAWQLQENQLIQGQISLERFVALAAQQPAQIESLRDLNQAYLLLSQLAEKRKDYTAAQDWLNKIEGVAILVPTQTRRASILARQGKLEEGRQLIRQLPERNPEEARIKLNAEIGLLREFKRYELAYTLLAQTLATIPDDTDLLYEQSMMAEKLHRLTEMERLLRQIIQLKPDFYNAYNALGYSFADRAIRLSEARELIRKALSYAPTDPFIQDSLGWVEFRMGHAAEAAKIFQTAYQIKSDPEIAAHYGEVLWSLGQRNRALTIWKEGWQLNRDNETLIKTLKRLRVKL